MFIGTRHAAGDHTVRLVTVCSVCLLGGAEAPVLEHPRYYRRGDSYAITDGFCRRHFLESCEDGGCLEGWERVELWLRRHPADLAQFFAAALILGFLGWHIYAAWQAGRFPILAAEINRERATIAQGVRP